MDVSIPILAGLLPMVVYGISIVVYIVKNRNIATTSTTKIDKLEKIIENMLKQNVDVDKRVGHNEATLILLQRTYVSKSDNKSIEIDLHNNTRAVDELKLAFRDFLQANTIQSKESDKLFKEMALQLSRIETIITSEK